MKKNIRVLFVAHLNEMGGASQSLFQLMIELRKDFGVEPILLVQKPLIKRSDYSLLSICKQNQIECYSFYFFWFKERRTFVNILKYLSNILWFPYIFLKLHKLDVDIVHSNSSVIDIGLWISKIKKKPHVWHLREFGYLDFRFKCILGKKYERFLYSKNNTFISISNVVKNYYVSFIPENKIRLIYNGIAVPSNNLISCHSCDTMNICMVGRLSPAKNQLLSLQGVNYAIHNLQIKDIHLFLIGHAEADYVKILHQYVNDNNLENYVTFVGESKEVPLLLSKMDVGLMLSRNEAFGRVTVEYMMHNLAVIAVDTGANPEIISDSIDGYLIKMNDYKTLADKIRALSINRELLGKISQKGRVKALGTYSSRKNTEGIFNLYSELLS